MARVKGKALPRRERGYPLNWRVYSTNFPDQLNNAMAVVKCWTTSDEAATLEHRYLRLFKRYRTLRDRYLKDKNLK